MDGDVRTPEVKVEAVLDQPPVSHFAGIQYSAGPDRVPQQYSMPTQHGTAQYLGMARPDLATHYSGHPHPGIHVPSRPDLGNPYSPVLDVGPQYLGRPDLVPAYPAQPEPVATYMDQPLPGIPLPTRPDDDMPYVVLSAARPEPIDPDGLGFHGRHTLVSEDVGAPDNRDGSSGLQHSVESLYQKQAHPVSGVDVVVVPATDGEFISAETGAQPDVDITKSDIESEQSFSDALESEPETGDSGESLDDDDMRPFPCDDCAVTFVDRLQLATHERMHGDEAPMPCRECGRVFYYPLALSRHERVHLPRPHRDPPVAGGRRCQKGGSDGDQFQGRFVKCGVCEDEFKEQEMRDKHIGFWWCSQCQRVFGLHCQLDRHGCVNIASIKTEKPDSPLPPVLQKNKRKPGRPRKLRPEEAAPIENRRKKREESKKAHLSQEDVEGQQMSTVPDLPVEAEEPLGVKTRRPRKSAMPKKQYLSSDPEDTEPDSESDPEWTGEMDWVEVSDEEEPSAARLVSKSVKCEICDKTFRSHNSLSRHLVRHISQKIANHAFKEGKRKSKFEKEEGESAAAAASSDMPAKFTCKLCGIGFHSRVTMQRHKQAEHGETGIRYQCELCPMSYDRSDLITRHTMKEHGQERTHKCTKCKACFTQASLLESHMKLHDKSRQPYVPYRMRAKCSICKQRFRSQDLMAKHECPGPRARVMCDVCGRSCATEAVLRRHQLLHVAVRPCACDTCGARFVDKYALKAHAKIHLPDRPHVCHICARGFKARGLLKRHMQFHTDERPFVCDHCGKAFKAANQLQNHIRIHTGEKPFPCTICGKPFRQAQQLKTHMKTHDPNKPHKAPKRQDEGWVQDLLLGSMRSAM